VSRLHGAPLPPSKFPSLYRASSPAAAIQRRRFADFPVMAGTKLVREERVPIFAIAEVGSGRHVGLPQGPRDHLAPDTRRTAHSLATSRIDSSTKDDSEGATAICCVPHRAYIGTGVSLTHQAKSCHITRKQVIIMSTRIALGILCASITGATAHADTSQGVLNPDAN
jgi:hypothetical protein